MAGRHVMKNGNFINIDKKFRNLKVSQREHIYSLIKDLFIKYVNDDSVKYNEVKEKVLFDLMAIINKKNINISYRELSQFYSSKLNKLKKLV